MSNINLEKCRTTTLEVLKKLGSNLSIDLTRYEERHQEILTETILTLTKQESEENRLRVMDEFLGHGPLKDLILDETVTEILVNSANEIWLERAGHLYKHEDQFLSKETYRNFFERLFTETRTEVTVNMPFTDTSWLTHRVHLVAPPVATEYTLSLRKKSFKTWSFERLTQLNWASDTDCNTLRKLIQDRRSMLIVGGTSSGKTSVLNSCLQEIKATERSVLIEDTKELTVPNAVSTSLLSRTDPKGLVQNIYLHDLVKQALRMRPDRIIMGEVRGAEAKDLLMALSTGHEGSMGTLHANTAQEALLRLEMLIQLGAPQWSLSAIRRLIYLALNYVVVVKRDSDGMRKLEGIYRISSVEDFGFLTEKIST